MMYRSWLLVPASNEKKLALAVTTEADVVVVDLDVQESREGAIAARQHAGAWLTAQKAAKMDGRPLGRWARIHALDRRSLRDDLSAVLPGAPDGIMLPGASGPDAVRLLSSELYEMEPSFGLVAGSTPVIAMTGGTAEAAITITTYFGASLPRLTGLAWGTESLVQRIGARRSRDKTGEYTDTFRFIRAQTLLTALARDAMALDAFHPDPADAKGLKAAAMAARSDGFTGMLAIHPAQIALINKVFTPTQSEVEEARSLVSLFETGGDHGTFDRRTISPAQVQAARRVIDQAAPLPARSAATTALRPA